mmetsp:Transcript_62251/g.182506  ORF Transcript_62251/g.182506 Transcript_62251/m.182506 type:complete len:215 (+) Transcript_62251:899-1543(+)
MLGSTSGFRSTSSSSSLPGPPSPFHFLQSCRIVGGSSRTLLEMMRIFSRLLHSPIVLGSCVSSLKDMKRICSFFILNWSGKSRIRLCEMSSSLRPAHSVMLSGIACRRLFDRFRSCRLVPPLRIEPKSGGSELRWLWERLSTSSLPNAFCEKTPAGISRMRLNSRMSSLRSLQWARTSTNRSSRLWDRSSLARASSSSRPGGKTCSPQRTISTA